MNVENVNKTLDAFATANLPGRAEYAGGRNGSAGTPKKEISFSERLVNAREEQAKSLSFSKHAEKRLSERGISVDKGLMGDLADAVDKAREKGAKDVAVIGRNGIFIVNVPHNVVVTTMGAEDMHNRIFTNIDSAVLM